MKIKEGYFFKLTKFKRLLCSVISGNPNTSLVFKRWKQVLLVTNSCNNIVSNGNFSCLGCCWYECFGNEKVKSSTDLTIFNWPDLGVVNQQTNKKK